MHKKNKNTKKKIKTKKNIYKKGGNPEDNICSICQTELGPDSNILYKHNCNNSFHISCILKWCNPQIERRFVLGEDANHSEGVSVEEQTISVNCNCPICRQPIGELPFTYKMCSVALDRIFRGRESLINQRNKVQQEYINLVAKHNNLVERYNITNEEYINLVNKYNNLTSEYNNLVRMLRG